jgi:hypothetical protein
VGRAQDENGAIQRGRPRRRLLIGAVVGVLVVAAGIAVQRIERPSQTSVGVLAQSERPQVGSGSATTTAPRGPSTTSAADGIADEAPSTTANPSPTTTTTASQPTATTQLGTASSGTGTASLVFGGVLTGQLVDAVAHCDPRPNLGSQLTVNGTLNGTPWVLFVQSYNGENGVWQVLTGEAGGVTGMTGQGYATTATYPATVQGVTQIDWARGATLHVALTSRSDQTTAGDAEVQGTITCGQ